MSTQDEQISNICDEIRALQLHVARLPVTPNHSSMHQMKELFVSGDGLLAKMRPPPALGRTKRTRKVRESLSGEDDDGDSVDDESDTNTDGNLDGVLDEDRLEDPNSKGRLGEENALEYLKSLENIITERQQTQPVEAPASLRPHVQPFAHQLKATALCLQSEHSPFKGMLFADLPGLGKTLALLMAFLLGRKPGDGPSLVVVPASCGRQWMEEIKENFKEGTLRALLLTDSNFLPHDLYRYDVIITSYNYVTSEATRLAKFDQQMEDYEKRKTNLPPKRPKVVLLSGIWKMEGVQLIGRYVALDESHAIKNSSGRSYAANKQLRERFLVCFPTTGTPLDNTWADVFAPLSLLRGHPFTSMLRMREVFTDGLLESNKKDKRLSVPRRKKLLRLVRLLHACSLSRPASLFTRNLPPLYQQVVFFDLPKTEKDLSNEAYNTYELSLGSNYDDAAYGGKGDGESQKFIKWSAVTKATQYAFHPGLPRIMELVRKTTKQNMAADTEMDDLQLSEEDQAEYDGWRAWIHEEDNSRSARVDVIVDIVNLTRDRHPGDAILVLDESRFFLDILEAAFKCMHEPVDVFRYDGGHDPAERHQTMRAFSTASGARVMLATRGAGGQGLNVQCANVVVRCGPWWKKSWEEQALARSYRPGQTKPVWLYEISAKGCRVEAYKRKVRGKKSKVNESIMALLTLDEGQQPPAWNEV